MKLRRLFIAPELLLRLFKDTRQKLTHEHLRYVLFLVWVVNHSCFSLERHCTCSFIASCKVQLFLRVTACTMKVCQYSTTRTDSCAFIILVKRSIYGSPNPFCKACTSSHLWCLLSVLDDLQFANELLMRRN